QCDCTRILYSEAIDQIKERGAIVAKRVAHSVWTDNHVRIVRLIRGKVQHPAFPPIDRERDLDGVGQNWVQAIDRDNFLRQTVICAVLIGRRARNAADLFAGADASKSLLKGSSSKTRPVGIHSDLQRGVS